MLNKINHPIKEKKKVRFDLPAMKQVRFNIPKPHEEAPSDNAEKSMQKAQNGKGPPPLSRQLQKGTPVNSVQSLNDFSEVWTLLEDLFSDETLQWMNTVTTTANTTAPGAGAGAEGVRTNIFSMSTHSMASFATPASRRRVQLLTKGFEHVEVLFNIPKPGARLKTTESRDTHQAYGAAKEKLLSQAFFTDDFSSVASSCFTEKYNKHWTFLCCLLADAILRKCVLHRDYAVFETGEGVWENESPENSRVHYWESKFEVVVGEVLGGETAAGQLLSLREFSLLRQYFDENLG
jgi:hypothetical protein